MAHQFQQFAGPYSWTPPNVSHQYPYHPGFSATPLAPAGQHAGPGQFYYPPGGHPASLQPQSSLQMLSQELVAAQRRLLQYTDLISNLYTELETIRNVVCHDCKERILPANLALQSQVPIVTTANSYTLESPQTSVISQHTKTGPASPFSSIHGHNFLLPQANVPGGHPTSSVPTLPIPAALSPQSLDIPVVSNLPTPSETIESSLTPQDTPLVADPSETSLTPQDTPLVESASIPESTNEKSQWSIVYNSNVEQVLDLTLVHAFKHTSKVKAVQFNPDGSCLAAGLTYCLGRIQMYDVKTRLLKCALAEYPGYSEKQPPSKSIWSICYSPDGRYLAIGGESFLTYIWEIASKRVVAVFKGHTKSVWSVDFSPNGRLLVTASWDGSLRLWKMRDGSSKLLVTEDDLSKTAKFSPNGRFVAASFLDKFLRIWDVRSGQLIGKWNGEKDIRCLAFSPDGEKLMSGAWDGSIKSWNVRSHKAQAGPSLSTEEKEKSMVVANEQLKFDGHSRAVRSVAISPDGKWLLTGSGDVSIWDMDTGVRQCTLEGHEGDVSAVDFSPVGNYIATGSEDGYVTLWTYKMV